MSASSRIRVVVADDHELVRRGLVGILSEDASIEVVAEAEDGEQTVERTEELQPDVVVLDIEMPRMDGLEAARLIRARAPGARVLVLTMHDDDENVLRMVRCGVAGYLLKDAAPVELLAAVSAIGDGRPYFGQHALKVLVEHVQD